MLCVCDHLEVRHFGSARMSEKDRVRTTRVVVAHNDNNQCSRLTSCFHSNRHDCFSCRCYHTARCYHNKTVLQNQTSDLYSTSDRPKSRTLFYHSIEDWRYCFRKVYLHSKEMCLCYMSPFHSSLECQSHSLPRSHSIFHFQIFSRVYHCNRFGSWGCTI